MDKAPDDPKDAPLTLSKSRHAWSDARLVKEGLSGSEGAWALLIEKYKALIYSVPVKYGQNPPRSYSEVAAELGLEMGSIGLTRQRCLQRLRRRLFELGTS